MWRPENVGSCRLDTLQQPDASSGVGEIGAQRFANIFHGQSTQRLNGGLECDTHKI